MGTKWLCFMLVVSGTYAGRTYKCNDGKCTKELIDDTSSAVSIEECKLTCLPYAGLWPAPTGEIQFSKDLVSVSIGSSKLTHAVNASDKKKKSLSKLREFFVSQFKNKESRKDDILNLSLFVDYKDEETEYYAYGVDESYSLTFSPNTSGSIKTLEIRVSAGNYIGAQRGVVTATQLMAYDDIRQRYRTVSTAYITDKPFYKHRGVSIDTARSYFPVESIYRIIDGMTLNKLNSLHWHITDTHSFPYVSDAFPVLAADGAYSKSQVYTPADIENIVEYAKTRGVRVTPELDAPAHVGEGWVSLDPELITCFRWEPWTQYCVEPPCGQFNPTKSRVYDVLLAIYQEWAKLFKSDLFHLGGDEVNLNCWKSTESITKWMTENNYSIDEDGFHKLWEMYQNRSYDQLKTANPKATPVLWTSTLTEHANVTQILNPAEYIIQIWTLKTDQQISKLINNKYRVIFTNYDELYMDCGAGAWIGGPGQNWCSPYKGWQTVYEHDPIKIVQGFGIEVTEGISELLLGSESALWTEQVDSNQLEGRLWPRVAALAERLWTRPSWSWEDVQYRMNHHRERLVNSGLRAELLQPAWCYQNDGFCGTGV